MSKPEPFLSLGFAGIDWIEHYLIHGPGDVQGQPIELDDEFAAFIAKAYRVDREGNRLVRRAFISRAKGRAKSELAAMVECFEALGPCRFDHWAEAGEVSDWGYEYEEGEPVGAPLIYVEALNVATEESQAGNTYDNVYYMLNADTCSPALLQDYGKIDVGLTRINLPNKRGFLEPVTSADTSKDGGKSTFIVADETHLWILPRLKRLHGIMTRNLLKRKAASGWMLETSTMYGSGEGSVAEATHEYAMAVSVGRKHDRTLLFDHRQADESINLGDRAGRLKALRQAYGPAAEWMNLDAICDSWDDPQVSEEDFRRYWLNQPVAFEPEIPAVIDLKAWAALKDADAPAPVRAALVVDVSPGRKRASIGIAGDAPGGRTLVMVVSGSGTAWVVPEVVRLREKRDIVEVALQPTSQAGSLIPDLVKAGVPFEALTSTHIGQATAAFIEGVKEKRLAHAGQQELDAAVGNARTRFSGEAELWDRRKREVDISPLVAASAAALRWGQSTQGPSIYETRGLVQL